MMDELAVGFDGQINPVFKFVLMYVSNVFNSTRPRLEMGL